MQCETSFLASSRTFPNAGTVLHQQSSPLSTVVTSGTVSTGCPSSADSGKVHQVDKLCSQTEAHNLLSALAARVFSFTCVCLLTVFSALLAHVDQMKLKAEKRTEKQKQKANTQENAYFVCGCLCAMGMLLALRPDDFVVGHHQFAKAKRL